MPGHINRAGVLPAITALLALSPAALAEEATGGHKHTATLDEVVVTAPPTDAPLTVVTDPKAPHQPIPPADGSGYLKQIPGFSVVRKGGNGGDPLLRGQGGSRLNVLMDDTPLLGGCGGRMDPPTAYIFPESYDRITVIKGPQTVVHGSGNVAGTVLFERDTPRFDEPAVHGTATAIVGSHGRNDQLLDATTGMREGYVRAIGTRSQADDYEDGDGNTVRSSYLRRSLSGAIGWTPDANTVLEGSFDLSEGEAAYADRSMDGVAFDRQGFKLDFSKEAISPLIAKVKAEAYYNYIDHIMDNYSLRTNTGMKMSMNPDRTTIGGRASVDLAVTSATMLTLGTDYTQHEHTGRSLSNAEINRGLTLDDKDRVTDMVFRTGGLFAQAEHALSPASRLMGGLRGDYVDVDHESMRLEDDDLLISGFGRYEHDFDIGVGAPLTAYAGFGHVERTADWWERNRVFDLDSEKVNQIDVGVVATGTRWRGGLTLFYANYDDYILIQTTTGTSTTARNIDAHTIGGELDVGYAITDSLSLYGALTYTYGQNDTDDRPLAQMPPLEFRGNLQYDDGKFVGGLVLRAAAEQNRVARGQGSIVGTDVSETDGFVTLALNAGFRPWKDVLLMAGIDNLFDATYSEHVNKRIDTSVAALGYDTSSIKINEPGRTFWARASIKF